jgi:hypothetical protein
MAGLRQRRNLNFKARNSCRITGRDRRKRRRCRANLGQHRDLNFKVRNSIRQS